MNNVHLRNNSKAILEANEMPGSRKKKNVKYIKSLFKKS